MAPATAETMAPTTVAAETMAVETMATPATMATMAEPAGSETRFGIDRGVVECRLDEGWRPVIRRTSMGLHLLRALAIVAGCALCAVLGPASVRAQSAGSQDEARAHYERGIALYDEGQFVAALAEFEAAYTQSRRAPILYNVGQIHARLGRAVEAVDALERYLAEGGASIAPERRALVERELETQRARIATVTLTVSVPGATVTLDDEQVGVAPLASPLRLSAGEHVVAARADGFETARFRFRIAGGEARAVTLELVARGEGAARLRLVIDVPGVDVLVDGRSVGLSPIEIPLGLPPGSHRIELSRPGYEPLERTVELPPSGEATLALDLVRAPSAPAGVLTRVALALPTTSHTVRIDGETLGAGTSTIDLPHGLHDLSIEAEQMDPVARRIDVPAGPTFVIDPQYRWQTPVREERRAAAASQRLGGALTATIGAVLGLGGGAMLLGREAYRSDQRIEQRIALINTCRPLLTTQCEAMIVAAFSPEADLDDFVASTNLKIDVSEALLITGGVLVGVGSAALIGGLIALFVAPSDESIDAGTTIRPTVSLDVGLGGLSLRGTF